MKSPPIIISTGAIVQGLPIPQHRGLTRDLLELKPGGSRMVYGKNGSIRSTCYYLSKIHHGYKFQTRTEEGGTRVWRVEK